MSGTEGAVENREARAEKVIDLLRRTHVFEFVQNVKAGKESMPDFETFKNFLQRINGVARNIPRSRRSFDGEDVQLKGFVDTVNLRQEDKEPLLKEVYEAAQHISKEDVKYLLPAALNAVHLFADGNGRTSRVLHLLLRDHPSEEECLSKMRTALSEDGRFDSFDVSPGLIHNEIESIVMHKHGWTFDAEGGPLSLGPIQSGIATIEIRTLDRTHPHAELAQEILDLYKEDVRYVLTALRETLGDEKVINLSSNYINVPRVSPKKLLENLSEKEWINVFDAFYQFKKEHVEYLIRIFTEPEKYKVADGSQTLRDYFIERIECSGSKV